MIDLDACRALDAADPLRSLREHFLLPQGVIYLDGNSLGPLPRATPGRVADAVTLQWGQDLIRSWNSAGWFDLPRTVGDKIAPWIGAGPNEVVATDSTSVNLFKVLSAALKLTAESGPNRRVLLSERSNFPTDLYIAETLCAERGLRLVLVEPEELPAALSREVAVLMLTHVNYRTGAMHDMATLTRAAHEVGALAVWDLAHSAGAVPVDLHGADADFAVGCGYKYLNGGPGAPAFVWVHPRHVETFRQPLAGWWGHAAPFEFAPGYAPAPGIGRYLCGTQPVLSLVALDAAMDVFALTQPLGGMAALRAKSLALTDAFIDGVHERCAGYGLRLVTPREPQRRGSQVCLALDAHVAQTPGSAAFAIVQALIARGVIGDFRAGDGGRHPDILRFGFAPLYLGFEDVWHAVEHLRRVLEGGEWRRAEFQHKQTVT